MTIPSAPLPSIPDLFEALRSVSSDGAPWLAGGVGREVGFFGRGGLALAGAAAALRGADPDTRWKLWLPEYFCEGALAPMRSRGIPLGFYSVREDLTPVFPDGLQGPGALVLVHYFGFPNALEEARAVCRRAGLVLIEDAAHVLIPQGGIGSEPWVIYSPHKLLPLPSLGILVHPETVDRRLIADAGVPATGASARWALRRLAQSALRLVRVPWHRRRSLPQTGGPIDGAFHGPSPFGRRLLASFEGRLEEIGRRRRENFLFLRECTNALGGCEPIHQDLPKTVCPYAYPLRVPDAARVVGALQVSGIPAYLWPDLPPEAVSPTARRLSAETVLLPVHQSLLTRELELMRIILRRVVHRH